MTIYVLIEYWDNENMIYNTGHRTMKEAKKRAKQVEKETGNYVSIHEIEVKRKKAA
jgi:hypothetical protein